MVSKVLIIDDDEQICRMLKDRFSRMGFEVSYRMNLADGLNHLFSTQIDVIFLDVNLPDGDGLEAIRIIKQKPSAPEVIIITADESADGAEMAMKSKAWDYISKRGSYKKFVFALERAAEYRRHKQANQPQKKLQISSIIGRSPQITACLENVAAAASSEFPVLITGETGTGKELFSKAIHENSSRTSGEFIVVDCGSLPENLIESMLFGHTKGAFTGADADKIGLMKMADGGTLFLDEVGELPMRIQMKFLRALQEKKFRPIGSKEEVKSNFRLICATHRDLNAMVDSGDFRQDLFFRLFSMHIHLPSLKERIDDIRLLVRHRMKTKPGTVSQVMVSDEFFEELELYDWPGNIRELMNTIDLVSGEAGDGITLYPHHLPEHIRAFNMRKRFDKPVDGVPAKTKSTASLSKFKDHIELAKRQYVKQLMAVSQGSKKEACRISGLSMGHLYRLLQQFGIK